MASTLLQTFQFQLKLQKSPEARAGSEDVRPTASLSADQLGDGAFQECSGLDIELEIKEFVEGGRNDGVIQRVGRMKVQPIVLKRGMFFSDGGTVNGELWGWIQSVAAGERPIPRYDGIIEVLDFGGDVVATWTFTRGLPSRVKGPELNAKTGEIAIEELHIAHEGLRLEDAG